MKIKEFRIDNLYGKYSFKSTLDEKVNILVGNNGAFKTTVLSIIRHIATYGEVPNVRYKFAGLTLNNGIMVTYPRKITKKEENMKTEDYVKVIKLDYVSTFDIKDKDTNTQETLLDKKLTQLQSDYGYYLNGLLKQLTGDLNKLGNVTKEQFEKIYTRRNLFIQLVNEAFKETGKTIDNEADKLRFIIDDNTSIGADMLSSGEKQLLIILLTVLLEDGREYVLMMDEPEISLHISWQYELLNWILKLNPNVQLIMTTHSPMIFADGWGDKSIHMENITTIRK